MSNISFSLCFSSFTTPGGKISGNVSPRSPGSRTFGLSCICCWTGSRGLEFLINALMHPIHCSCKKMSWKIANVLHWSLSCLQRQATVNTNAVGTTSGVLHPAQVCSASSTVPTSAEGFPSYATNSASGGTVVCLFCCWFHPISTSLTAPPPMLWALLAAVSWQPVGFCLVPFWNKYKYKVWPDISLFPASLWIRASFVITWALTLKCRCVCADFKLDSWG